MEADTGEHDAGTGFLGGLGFGGCGDAATDGCEGRGWLVFVRWGWGDLEGDYLGRRGRGSRRI